MKKVAAVDVQFAGAQLPISPQHKVVPKQLVFVFG
jgi:hypothetical protein